MVASTPGNSVTQPTALAAKPSTVWGRIEQALTSGMDWIVLFSLLLAVALRVKTALGLYLNPDEALHYLLSNQSNFLASYEAGKTNAHPPLLYAVLYYWRFLGNSEVMLRMPSILASTIAGWLVYRWSKMVLGGATALIALLLLSFSPVMTTLGAEVRHYSLLLLGISGGLYFFERAFRDQKASSIAYGALFLYIAILAHYSALWFVLSAGIYVLLRIWSLQRAPRIAWIFSQLGAVALYAWLYAVHISKLRRSPIEAEAMTGWLRAEYFQTGETTITFLRHATLDVFQFLFGSQVGGDVALIAFLAGVAWLCVKGLIQKKRDLTAFGLLLMLPFVFGMAASVLDFYPYGGTRHCMYLLLFATTGSSFLIAIILRDRLLPILLLAVLILPYWFLHRMPDPQEMGREEQRKGLMEGAMAALHASVPPSEPIFSDYQASILLAYYLGRDHPAPAPRECGGVSEIQYGAYRVVVLNVWSATAAQLKSGLDGWQKGCDLSPRSSFWIFDAGWGRNLVDDVKQSSPNSVVQASRWGESISLFQVRADR